ncbi:hypothetical protein AK830_g12295 [Neonectria ditissima]|uniref:F-box domain-containing protein n=1 Tax=Neonectria ditissima TaxID=78410 RepID=A0A0P7APS2_9HYPO|nr:hypothetical protein AK830_g12295 [Neonectria ditissima]
MSPKHVAALAVILLCRGVNAGPCKPSIVSTASATSGGGSSQTSTDESTQSTAGLESTAPTLAPTATITSPGTFESTTGLSSLAFELGTTSVTISSRSDSTTTELSSATSGTTTSTTTAEEMEPTDTGFLINGGFEKKPVDGGYTGAPWEVGRGVALVDNPAYAHSGRYSVTTLFNMAGKSPCHLPLKRRCDACADIIFGTEITIALFKSKRLVPALQLTQPFPFPEDGIADELVHKRKLCLAPNCGRCKKAPEFVLAHYACYGGFNQMAKIVMGRDDEAILDLLWTIGIWRSPWAKAQPIQFDQDPVDQEALSEIAAAFDFPQLRNMPMDVISKIHHYSNHALIWRWASIVSRLYRQTTESDLESIRINQLLYWKRGVDMTTEDVSNEEPPSGCVVRIIIDREGIDEIIQLDEATVFDTAASTQNSVCVFEELSSFSDKDVAQLMNGFMRLSLPTFPQGLKTWRNTFLPPEKYIPPEDDKSLFCLERFDFIPLKDIHAQLHVVVLRQCRGITFFLAGDKLYGIHPHLTEDESAIKTFERFSKHQHFALIWVYVPIPPEDEIIQLAVCKIDGGIEILQIRMKLSGDILLGRLGRPPGTDPIKVIDMGHPTALIYAEPVPSLPVSLFCGSCTAESDNPLPLGYSFPPRMGRGYFSWAPFSGIKKIRVYIVDTRTYLCSGLEIYYENGGCRALVRHSGRGFDGCYSSASLLYLDVLSGWSRVFGFLFYRRLILHDSPAASADRMAQNLASRHCTYFAHRVNGYVQPQFKVPAKCSDTTPESGYAIGRQ